MNNFKLIFTALFTFLNALFIYAHPNLESDSITIHDIEELLDSVAITADITDTTTNFIQEALSPPLSELEADTEEEIEKEVKTEEENLEMTIDEPPVVYTPINIEEVLLTFEERVTIKKPYTINKRIYQSNPFFIDLVFKGYKNDCSKTKDLRKSTQILEDKLHIGDIPYIFSSVIEIDKQKNILNNLRAKTMRKLAVRTPYLILFQGHKLPDVSDLIDFKFRLPSIDKSVEKFFKKEELAHQKIEIEKIKYNPWTKKSNALLQLSQNYVSPNWHQGGTNNTAILGILNANLNYDNKKFLQWENFFEWRLGFNTVDGDTLRVFNTNEDITRAISKLGIKAGGNWYYSGSVDFSTQLYKSYKAVNSPDLKTNFLTPIRTNISIGFDYKHKKMFSMMLSPLSYKFVYANDTVNINQKSFGIPEGQKAIHHIGSSFRAQLSYSPFRELQIDSRLNFFTNYEKIEVDWELVSNLKINRYLSTRLSLNPRYDSTILTDDKAKLQFKQFLTIGFSYRLL